MKKLIHMNLNEKIDALKTVVEDAEISLSKKGTNLEDVESINETLNDVYNNIKYEFITGDITITPDGKRYPSWDGDAFREALNNRQPGLYFRMNSVMNALEDLYEMIK